MNTYSDNSGLVLREEDIQGASLGGCNPTTLKSCSNRIIIYIIIITYKYSQCLHKEWMGQATY